MKLEIDKEWCLNAARREGELGDPEVGAGILARDPTPPAVGDNPAAGDDLATRRKNSPITQARGKALSIMEHHVKCLADENAPLDDFVEEITQAILAASSPAITEEMAKRVDEWRIVKGERVLIFVVHPNAKFAKTPEELAEWQGWCVGEWTDFNKGGWTWHGHIGNVTHVAPLPPWPRAVLEAALGK